MRMIVRLNANENDSAIVLSVKIEVATRTDLLFAYTI